MPRDNLLNSACLELFEFIKRENLKILIHHLVETCRPQLQEITYVDTFQTLILRYDQMQNFNPDAETTLVSNDGTTTPNRTPNVNGNRWPQGLKDADAAEEAYFNTSDEEGEGDDASPEERRKRRKSAVSGNVPVGVPNGVTSSPMLRSLGIDYLDEDEDTMDTRPPEPVDPNTKNTRKAPKLEPSPMLQTPPPERLSDKRRREEIDDEDELGKLSNPKRRNSGSSVSSMGSDRNNTLKRKKGFNKNDNNRNSPTSDIKTKKIEISLASKTAASDQGSKHDEGR